MNHDHLVLQAARLVETLATVDAVDDHEQVACDISTSTDGHGSGQLVAWVAVLLEQVSAVAGEPARRNRTQDRSGRSV